MELTLQELRLKNFKGIRDFTISPEGKNITIFGDNASGKTTLIDGFLWLLFSKDSRGKADFEIKTLNPDGSPIHNLDHEVQGCFLIDGKKKVLRKAYAEKWTKKRGQTRPEFTGHSTDYYINGVPVKQKDYLALVSEIIDEDVFRMLTDPRHFCGLHWQKQREILLTICGDVDIDDIIASDGALAALGDVLGDHNPDDKKKIIAGRRKKINEELKEIPARIDELKNSLPDKHDVKKLKHLLGNVQQEKIALEEEKLSAAHGGDKARLIGKLSELKAARNEKQSNHRQEVADAALQYQTAINEKQAEANTLKHQLGQTEAGYDDMRLDIEGLEQKLVKLRKEWEEADAEEYAEAVDENCPACKQPLPEDQTKAAREAHREAFNKVKADTLADISKRGTAEKELLEAKKKRLPEVKAEIEELNKKLAGATAEIKQLEGEKKKLEDLPEPAEFKELSTEIEALEKQIEGVVAPDTSELDTKIEAASSKETDLQNRIALQTTREKSETRIAELEVQEKELAAEYERLEYELSLLDKYEVARVNLLDEKVNSRFQITKWKLFEEQINGGINPVCVATHEGVPHPSLNNGAQINCGLDIINVLSEHYDITAPIFIDNSESVTKYIDTKAQVIKLAVSEDHPELTIG